MISRLLIRCTLIALLVAQLHAAPAARPNILFILTEDQGAQAGFLNTPGIHTPHMDALASSGVYFNNAFVAYPVCSSSKACIYTALHNHTNGLLNNTINYHMPASLLTPQQKSQKTYAQNHIDPALPTWIERLRDAGYYQGVTHKLHVAPNEKFPYDEFIEHSNHAEVASFISRAKRQEKPWHLFYNISVSHRPYPNSDKKPIGVNPAKVSLPPYLPDTPVVRQDWAEYLAAIEAADALVGQGLAAVREAGEEGNTIIVFLGDHGPTFQHGKMTLYDLGLRTPLIIRAPGMKGGIRTDLLASELDLGPTLLDLLGLPPLPSSHGVSLKPILSGAPNTPPRSHGFAEIADRGTLTSGMQERSVFDGKWKLIYRENIKPAWRQVQEDSKDFVPWGNRTYAETVKHKEQFPDAFRILAEMDPQSLGGNVQALELYNLHADPHEICNLAGDVAYRHHKERLYATLRSWVFQTKDAGVQPPAAPPL